MGLTGSYRKRHRKIKNRGTHIKMGINDRTFSRFGASEMLVMIVVCDGWLWQGRRGRNRRSTMEARGRVVVTVGFVLLCVFGLGNFQYYLKLFNGIPVIIKHKPHGKSILTHQIRLDILYHTPHPSLKQSNKHTYFKSPPSILLLVIDPHLLNPMDYHSQSCKPS